MARLSISKAWDETSAFLRREGRLVTPVALATFMVPTTLFGWYNPAGDPSSASGGMGWPLTLIILIIAMIGQMVVAGLAIGWSHSVGDALTRAFKRVWGMLATAFLIFLPLTILLVIVLSVMLGNAGLSDPSQVTAEALAAVPGVSFAILGAILAFLVIAVRLFPLSAVAMIESANPFRLIPRCWQLTRGNSLRLLGTLLLILLASIVASLAVTVVVGAVATMIAGTPEPYSVSAMLIALADGLVTAAITSVTATLVGRIYVQLAAPIATVPEVEQLD